MESPLPQSFRHNWKMRNRGWRTDPWRSFLCRTGTLAVWSVLTIAFPVRAQRLEALWYSTPSNESTSSFLAHANRINILSPQVFDIDSLGVITGKVDPRVVARARESHTKLVPLVMNPGFSQPIIHAIITKPDVARRAAQNMAALCRDNHFDGIQLDIENVNISDRSAFTEFARLVATELHKVNCSASAAVVPRISDDPGPTSYHKWIFENWRGVYDYKALAESLDFISYMTYAQHTGGSTVGPVAGYTWMEECLKFALSLGVPPNKISLGLASYSDYWFPAYDEKTAVARQRGNDIGYAKVTELLRAAKATPVWDARDKSYSAQWSNAGVYEHLWIEDARSFAAKLELARKYKLRGYSVWVLGMEDPNVWQTK